jgi:dTDP-4-amino-4,6-dideoxygalactose transaminase
MTREVPFFDYKRLYTDQSADYIRIINDVGQRGAFIMQDDLLKFEQRIAKYIGANYAVGVGNATDGLEICLASLKEKKKGKVIISAHTMLATASAIIMNGMIPVPVDIGLDGLIDINSIEENIDQDTVGIMPTQLNGRVCDMDGIQKLTKKHELFLIEDAAQALGAKYKGKCAGTFGNSSAISFFPAKTLGSLGDAGIVITNSSETFDKVYQLHDHGRNFEGQTKSWGRNSRLDNLQAAILNWKLDSYESVVDRRRQIANLYNQYLNELPELSLPESPDIAKNNYDVFQNYELCVKNRDDLKEFLKKNGIGTLIQWSGKAIHQWENLGFNVSLPKVEKFFEECIMLPMNQFITDDDIVYICKVIKNFYKG